MKVGTRPTNTWLLDGVDRQSQMAVKADVLRDRPGEVLAVLPGAEAGVAALTGLVSQECHPSAEHQEVSGRSGLADSLAQLATAAMQAQEDLCLMQQQRGTWRLTAGCVCFPSHWRLTEKLGAGLGAIHEPVPGYAERLALATAKAFDRIASGTGMVERFNWILTDSAELFTPFPPEPQDLTASQVPDSLWLRTERQTLRPLPLGQGLAFTIRTFLTALADLTATEREALGESLLGISDELAEYRSSVGYRDVVRKWSTQLASPQEPTPPE